MSETRTAPAPILITGLGTFGAGGGNVEELWQNTLHGRTTLQMHDVPGRRIAVYRAGDPILGRTDAKLVRPAGRSAALALAAAREAWQHSGLSSTPPDPARIGVFIGSSRGPADIVAAAAGQKSKRACDSVYTAFSSVAGIIASALDIQGCAFSLSATCTSGAAAIHAGRQMLRSGELDLVLAGGVDAPLIDSLLEQLAATGVLSYGKGHDALRPFDVDRQGTVLGEGAAFLVLETAASAARRGARVHGILHASALSAEPNQRSRPSPMGEGMQRAVRTALQQCSFAPEKIDLAHLHGTGTRLNDAMESACVQALFGAVEKQPACWGTKAITGHTLGASASFQAILTLEAMRHAFLPGTANCLTQDPACLLRLSLGKGAPAAIRTAACLTSGFWGKSSCLVFGAPEA